MSYMDQFTKDNLPWAHNQESETMLLKKQYATSIRKLIENSGRIKKPTRRETEVYELWRSGKKYDEISVVLGITPKTVRELKYRYQYKLKKNSELFK